MASDYLGVPHPPGYPIWTLVTWFFQWIFHWVKYNGHPNPAWSVGLASAVSGAGACALLALLISRSGADLLRSIPALTDKIGFRTENTLCLVAGISGGLLLAFSPVLWSQSVIVEVYSLNTLFQMGVLLLIYMWMCRPKNDTLLYLAAFLFGLGLTNHQTLLFLGSALALAVVLRMQPVPGFCGGRSPAGGGVHCGGQRGGPAAGFGAVGSGWRRPGPVEVVARSLHGAVLDL